MASVAGAAGRRNVHARRLFDGIAHSYDRPAQVFSLFQYRGWHRFLVSCLKPDHNSLVLDVATGPGGVAARLAGLPACHVVGVDLSRHMLQEAQRNLRSTGACSRVSLVRARAEDLPFPDNSFDSVVFTFLLRYVDDPQATMMELSRVLKPGGQMASLEFYVPRGPILHPLWLIHTRLVMRAGTWPLGQGWRQVGSFLGPSISSFFHKYTLEDLRRIWGNAGLCNVETKVLSRGGALVMWGRKEAAHEQV